MLSKDIDIINGMVRQKGQTEKTTDSVQFDFRHLEKETKDNTDFRRVLFTCNNLQLVLMSLKPGEDIGMEVHDGVDQFFRIEEGVADLIVGDADPITLKDGDSVIITAGTAHNIQSVGEKDLKLYTIYGPPNHPPDRIQKTKKDAEQEEKTDDEGRLDIAGYAVIEHPDGTYSIRAKSLEQVMKALGVI